MAAFDRVSDNFQAHSSSLLLFENYRRSRSKFRDGNRSGQDLFSVQVRFTKPSPLESSEKLREDL